MIKLLNPNYFTSSLYKLMPFLVSIFIILIPLALWQSLYASPEDYQQGDLVRIMYVHVPSAWMSLFIYSFIAICSLSNIIWRTPFSYVLAIAAAPLGAGFTLTTLVTGSIWGEQTWGTWWVWDARLTSMLILFLFYVSYIAIINAGDNLSRSEKPAAIIALIGFINVPIVKFSVNIWNSLHQPASVFRVDGPSIHSSMLIPLMLMFTVFALYFIIFLCIRATTILDSIRVKNL
ncbi:MAG: Heme exporter protein [Rickettsiaceae bacterium]|jgi:heme exporter protein C|nr:Heme exporter protein [Rickettsiaceae bacterium]